MKELDFLIVAGGTGGHIFPALAIYEELIQNNKKAAFVTDQRGANYLKEYQDSLIILKLSQFKKSPIALYQAISLAYFAFIKMLILMIQKKPHTIIAFGGYPCLPIIMAAVMFGKKIIIHEQNAVMGKMNRFASRFASKIWLGFEDTQLIPAHAIHKTEFVGTPIRNKITTIKKKSKKDDSLNILIIGGSQAASIFAEIVPTTIKQIKNKLPKNLKIVQQCRNQEEKNKLVNFYIVEEINAEIAEFFTDIEQKLHEADIIISRSGASSLNEIMVLNKPSILVPYAHATDNHQFFNAKFLSDKNAAMLIEQKDLTPENLGEKILELIDPKNYEAMVKNLAKTYKPTKGFL